MAASTFTPPATTKKPSTDSTDSTTTVWNRPDCFTPMMLMAPSSRASVIPTVRAGHRMKKSR